MENDANNLVIRVSSNQHLISNYLPFCERCASVGKNISTYLNFSAITRILRAQIA